MRSTTSEKIMKTLERIFMIHGLPLSITSDNGPQFVSSEFERYFGYCGIRHRKTTPLWPQANEEVERQTISFEKDTDCTRPWQTVEGRSLQIPDSI